MNIVPQNYSIAEIRDMMENRTLVVNEEYQRQPRLWPSGPRTYFIDTVLSGFPFPKLYLYEYLDQKQKTRREIVDGQQRVHTIIDFLEGKFRLGSGSPEYQGQTFSDLEPATQHQFLSYAVPVDVIRNAEKAEILQMFRRMNAYTLPLNEAEKRHSAFFGEFKVFINRYTDKYAAFLSEWGILTKRQMVRMADAELLTEMALALEVGTISTSAKHLRDLYKRYDGEFPQAADYGAKIDGALDFIITNFSGLRNTYMMKPFIVHSLFCALVHNRNGLPGFEAKTQIAPIEAYCPDIPVAIDELKTLAAAHESKDEGALKPYADACSAGSNREPQRTTRVSYICRALRGELWLA